MSPCEKPRTYFSICLCFVLQAPSISSKGGHHDNDDMEEQGGDNMDTTRLMLDWAEQNYNNPQYSQDQVDGKYIVMP